MGRQNRFATVNRQKLGAGVSLLCLDQHPPRWECHT
jgi:hypothetical protein